MSNVVWVTAPLVAIGAYLLARRILRRPHNRHMTNVIMALVLLAYFGATAGLGIFWVARQQLPVFDLHYLFGYAVLLLVVIHVSFNARIVIRSFFGPPRRRERPAKKRPLSFGLAVLAVGCGAFALGTRARPSEVAPVVGGAEGMADSDAILRYHELSSESRTGAFARAPATPWHKPPAFKAYPDGLPRFALPAPSPPADARSVHNVIADGPRSEARPLDTQDLANVLHYTGGVTEVRAGLHLRAAPSSGALFPAELYLAVRDVAGLAPGLYHFDPEHHALVRLSDVAPTPEQLGHPRHPLLATAPVTVVTTAVFARTGHKYGDRAYRYILADLGHLIENLRLTSAELGYAAEPLRAFDESHIVSLLALDEDVEAPIAVVPLVRDSGVRSTPTEFEPEVAKPLDPSRGVHRATSLRLRTEPASKAIALPEVAATRATIWQAIQERRSVRDYASLPLSMREMSALLAASARPAPRVSDHVELWVIAHRVEGLSPGAYRYDRLRHAIVPQRLEDLSAETQSTVLSQRMMGTAAAVFVLAVDRDAVVSAGARAYRHAWLEVGMMGERLYLEAGALGVGACAAGAFFDDEAVRLLGAGEGTWVAHFVSVGRM